MKTGVARHFNITNICRCISKLGSDRRDGFMYTSTILKLVINVRVHYSFVFMFSCIVNLLQVGVHPW